MNTKKCIGCKIGSQNTVIAYRDEKNEIKKEHKRTCVRYPKGFTHNNLNGLKPIVGDGAWGFDDTFMPMHLGLVEGNDGIRQITDILSILSIPIDTELIVLASPAMEVNEGKNRLVRAIESVAPAARINELSEGMCSAIYILKDPQIILSSTFFTLNLGSSTTEFGCVSEGNIVHLSAHSEVSGNTVDDAIQNKARNAVSGAMFTKSEICKMKESLSLVTHREFVIKGMTRNNFIEAEISNEMVSSIDEYTDAVSDIVKGEILNSSKITPAIRRKAIDMPLILSGGMSNIEGLPELIMSKLNKKINGNFTMDCPKDHDGHIAPAIGALLLAEAIAEEEE